MKSKYAFWLFLSVLLIFLVWWYYYAFTRLNTEVPDDVVVSTTGSTDGSVEDIKEDFKNPDPREVGEALSGEITYQIDASSLEQWIYFDFSRGTIVDIDDQSSLDWDIGFRRALIISNSGDSNPKGMGGIIEIADTEFESVIEAPDSGYIVDKSTNVMETENPAIRKWYDYNYLTHGLKPKKNVYIIRTADGKYAKLRILKFTCGKLAGCYRIKYVYQGNGSRNFQ